jgi:hypothetical protein
LTANPSIKDFSDPGQALPYVRDGKQRGLWSGTGRDRIGWRRLELNEPKEAVLRVKALEENQALAAKAAEIEPCLSQSTAEKLARQHSVSNETAKACGHAI